MFCWFIILSNECERMIKDILYLGIPFILFAIWTWMMMYILLPVNDYVAIVWVLGNMPIMMIAYICGSKCSEEDRSVKE